MGGILGASLVAGMSTPLGAWLVASTRTVSPRVLAFTLALASGVMATVVAAELAPTSVAMAGWGLFVGGAATGAVMLALLRGALAEVVGRTPDDAGRLRLVGWFIALAIALHDVPEGMAIGAGDVVHRELGVVLALAIALHNIPEGMSIAAPLAMGGVSRLRILAVTALIGLVTPVGTVVALILGRMGPDWSALVLALASGAMLYVVGRDTLPEAWRAGRSATMAGLLAGAVLMLALAAVHGPV
jgi:ZIP family zinc transporter